MEHRESIIEGYNALLTEFDGLKLKQLIVCQKTETKEPVILFLKIENQNWHEYFLDAGLVFWRNYDEMEAEIEMEEEDAFCYVDKTNELDLFEKVISTIRCEADHNNSKLIIEFKSKEKLILQTITPEIFDSETELIFKK
ncbi:hypothetical protein [Flavobacterium hungaricum]|uniref:Uncharacterized protein n=1 Tax=Flavobacterium hungaricum TaxID=2082725 RepID=A0ABR9TQE9_9FLAO|nr:hypothetical protein [Flavobacterium hungaricum]MBE8727491.1 hypothetical protein [Flavobacterium hungaricum]